MIPMTTSITTFAVLELLLLKASWLLVGSAEQIDLLFSFMSYRTKLKLDYHNRNKLKKKKEWVEHYKSIVWLRMLYLVSSNLMEHHISSLWGIISCESIQQ